MEGRTDSDETEDSTEYISKQNVEGAMRFLLTAYNKMSEDRDELKKKLSSKKEPELEDLENSQPLHIANTQSMF